MKLVSVPAPKNWQTIPRHELCGFFPSVDTATMNDMVDSMKRSGIREPIILFEDPKSMILDGYNRNCAARAAGIVPTFLRFDGTHDEAVQFVIDKNLNRRDLSPDAKVNLLMDLHNWQVRAGRQQNNSATVAGFSQNIENSATVAEFPVSVDRIASEGEWSARRVQRNLAVRRMAPERVREIVAGKKTAFAVIKETNAKNAEAAKPKVPARPKDSAGRAIHPKAAEALTTGRERCKALIRQLQALRREVVALGPDLGRLLHQQTIETDFGNLEKALKFAAPYTSCPLGDPCPASCKLCRGTQWIGEQQWAGVPAPLKKGAA